MSRIAFVTNALHCGGAASSLLRLARELMLRGHTVDFVVTAYRGEWFERPAEFGSLAHFIAGHNRAYPPLHAHRVGTFLRKGCYDVLCFSTEVYGLSALNLVPNHVAAITMCRSDEPDAYRENLANSALWNAAVAVSPAVAENARQVVPGRPVVLIANGTDEVPPGDLARRAPHGLPFRLAFSGRLHQAAKDILILPEIVAECRQRGLDVRLTVVGDGPDAPRLRSKIESLGLDGRIRLLGGQSHAEVYRMLLESHALLLPSFFEGLPGAPLEAQACGCVPIASRLPGSTDAVIRHGETGLIVDRRDAAAYADAVQSLLSDADRWSALSQAGVRRVGDEFSITTMGDDYERLFEDALAGKYPPARRRRRCRGIFLRSYSRRQLVPRPVRYLRHPVHYFLRGHRDSTPGG